MARASLSNAGLIGCGWMAELAHLATLERSASATLAAVAEVDEHRRNWLRRRLPHVRLVNADDLIGDDRIQIVVIALPTALAADMARAAFRAGKHVYVEKPGGRSAAEWRSAVDAWSAAGTLGGVGYNFRRNVIFLHAARTVREGRVGTVISVQSRFVWTAPHAQGWRAALRTGGGVLLDLASHHVDLITTLLGEPVARVRCTTRSLRVEEDAATLDLDLASGVQAQVMVSSAAGAAENRFTIVGTEGVLDVDLLDARPSAVRRVPGRFERGRRSWRAFQAIHPARLMRSPGREISFAAALTGFLDAVAKGEPFRPDPMDALRALAVIDAARTSADAGGSPVAVAPPPGE